MTTTTDRTIRLQTSRTIHQLDIAGDVQDRVGMGEMTVSRFLSQVKVAMAHGRHAHSVGFYFDGDLYALVWGRRASRGKGKWRNTRVLLAQRPAPLATPPGTRVLWDEDGRTWEGTSGGHYRRLDFGVVRYQVFHLDGTEAWVLEPRR